MLPVYADFIDLPSSVQDAKYGRKWAHDSFVGTTYSGPEIKLAPMIEDKKYIIRAIVDPTSSTLLEEFIGRFLDTSTWNESKDYNDDLHVDLIPNKRFKIQMKISKINKPIPKFFLD